jgi:outer membrane protein OmpA-like peptidoglycan-associated protein
MQIAYILCAALVAVLPAQIGRADAPTPAVYLGVDIGGHLVLDDWDMTPAGATGQTASHGGALTLRAGAVPWWFLSVEFTTTLLTGESDAETNLFLRLGGDVLIHPLRWNWSPHVIAGVGAYTYLSGDLGPDTDVEFHAGLGMRGMVADWLAVRIDFRYVLGDGIGDSVAENLQATVGLDFFVWRAPRDVPPPPDVAVVPTPREPATPSVPVAPVSPTVPFAPEVPVAPGVPVAPAEPLVPVEPASPKMPEELQRYSGPLKDIGFKGRTAALTSRSKKALINVANALARYPGIVVEIQSHTDDVGTGADNLELSHQRAQVVRSYLIDRGILAQRLKSRGYGESRPLVAKAGAAKRRQNDRIELQIVPTETKPKAP